MSIAALKPAQLAADDPLQRDRNCPPEAHTPEYDAGYDFRTLFYDCFYRSDKQAVILVCPLLLNLEAILTEGEVALDGAAVRPHIRRRPRYDEVWLKARHAPSQLSIRYQGRAFDLPIRAAEPELFVGLNCAVTVSKNNKPIWIEDWVRYHAEVHGLEGVVVFDNGSTEYPVERIDEALSRVNGLKRWRVLSAPMPFGSYPLAGKRSHSTFLQTSLLNVARLRFFSQARAVLSCDPDELVQSLGSQSVFDRTCKSVTGYMLFRGEWRVAGDGPDPVRHRDHVNIPADAAFQQTKYCINPRGLFGFSHWELHGAVKGALKGYLTREDIKYWHCRQISISWKYDRSVQAEPIEETDAALASLFEDVFGPDDR